MSRGVAIKSNAAALQAQAAGLSVTTWALTVGTLANLIDYDSGVQIELDSAAGSIRVASATAMDIDLVALLNHNWPTTAAITITVYETTAFGGASETVVTAQNPAGDFRTAYNDYWQFVITNATIIAQGGPKSIIIAVTGAGSAPRLGQLFVGLSTIAPWTAPNFKINYSYGYGQTLTQNEIYNRTVGGQTHGYRLNEQWFWYGLAWNNTDETTWRQLLNTFGGAGATLPLLWIPDTANPDCYFAQKTSPSLPATSPLIAGIYTVGPVELLEQARGID